MKSSRNWSSKIFSNLLILIGVLSIGYCLFGLSLGWGFYFGLKMFVLIGSAFIAHGVLRIFNKRYKGSIFDKVISLGIVAFIFSFVIVQALIIYGGHVNKHDEIDYMIILGAGIRGDEPSIELRLRLDAAIDNMNEHNVKKVILCGGKGSDQSFSEAYVMDKYLIEHGVDEDILIREEASRNTYENIENANKIIREIDKSDDIKVGIVSNDFHVYRAKLIAKKFELYPIGIPAKTPLYIIPNHYMKEYFSLLYYWVFLSWS